MMKNDIRKFKSDIVKYYEISLNDMVNLTENSFIVNDENGNSFFVKETIPNALEKYHFLRNQSCNNILFPILNKNDKFVTRFDSKAIYVNNYYKTFNVKDELRASNMLKELRNLHKTTSFKRQLNPMNARPKFEEITNRLDYQFRLLEDYVRSVESRDLNEYSMQILSNYQYILDAKRELVRLQKRIISSVKAKDGVEYNYIHNNPRLDHLLNIKGCYYLTSVEKGKIGISSLDLAKLYIENENLNIDYKSMFHEIFKNENNPFYYDYFRYLILLIYIRRMNISNFDYINGNVFITTAISIKKYFDTFSDYQEDIS